MGNLVVENLNNTYSGSLYGKINTSKDRYNDLKQYRSDFDTRAILIDVLAKTNSVPRKEDVLGNEVFYIVDEDKVHPSNKASATHRMKLDVDDVTLSEPIVPIGVQTMSSVIMTVMFNSKYPNYSLDLPMETLATEYDSVMSSLIAEAGSDLKGLTQEQSLAATTLIEERVLRVISGKRFDNIKAANLLHEFENRTITNAIKQQLCKNFMQFANLIFHYPKDVKTEREAQTKTKVIPFYRYALLSDKNGDIVECVIKEFVNKYSLTPEEVKWYTENCSSTGYSQTDFEVYTHIRFFGKPDARKYELVQEFDGKAIKDTYETGNEADCPYIIYSNPDAMSDWGTMYLEPYLGMILQACTDNVNLNNLGFVGSIATILMDKNAVAQGVAESFREMNGKVVPVNDVKEAVAKMLSFEISQNYTALANNKARMEQILKEAMMLISAVQQNKDRQTAEEVIRVSDEIKQRQGASYTTFEDFRGRIAERSKQRAISIGSLAKSSSDLVINMGLDRPNSEEYVNRLLLRLKNISDMLRGIDPILISSLNIGVISNMVLSSSGFNPQLFFDSEKLMVGVSAQMKAQAQQAQMQQIQQAVSSEVPQ
jgi:hypothetical protein